MKKVANFLRKVNLKLFKKKFIPFFNSNKPDFTGQKASDLIFDLLSKDKPCLISRFGNTEFNCVYQYKINNRNTLKKYLEFIKGNIADLGYSEKMKKEIQNNAGFFPAFSPNLDRFSKLMLSNVKNIDILGSWLAIENNFKEELCNAKTVHLEDLNAYNHKIPWSRILKGKKVLVVHPFQKSIESQYKKKDLLFKNKEILPDFNLITYKSIVSIADNHQELLFKDWFEALESMQRDIKKIDFDIAILGCGAYGLPLASYIKDLGKKAIHIGGATQILFGIKGKRWETEYDLDHLFNEFWIRPSLEEIPNNANRVEKGCYW